MRDKDERISQLERQLERVCNYFGVPPAMFLPKYWDSKEELSAEDGK